MKKMKRYRLILGVLSASLLAVAVCGCGPLSGDAPFDPGYFDLPQISYFPTSVNTPDGNRLSVQGVALGRYLFYDIRLGGHRAADSMLSCASCHVQAHAFDCGPDNLRLKNGRMRGAAGLTTAHAALPLINMAYNTVGFGWNRALEYPSANLENLIRQTLLDSAEFAGTAAAIEERIRNIEWYPPLFEAAFGSKAVTLERICFALAQFVRTLVSDNSAFDRFMRGETVLSEEAMRGYVLFTTEEGADCFHCHGGVGNVLFSNYDVLINGLDPQDDFNDPYDRASVTGLPSDKGAYRIPTLRNIEYTAPYMHDGRFSSLEEVIDQYSENVHHASFISPLMHHVETGGVQLTEAEKKCLKAFLLSLSDVDFIHNAMYANPFIHDTIPAFAEVGNGDK